MGGKGTSSSRKELPKGHGICLDLGAGQGRMKQFILSHGYNWVGLDIRQHRSLSVLADAHVLPFRNDAFDLVFMGAVLEHLHHPHNVLREVYRILKSCGLLYGWAAFLEPYHESYYHFSFRGLETLLNDCNFLKLSIWPESHVLNAMMQNFLPFIPGNLRERLSKSFALLHARIGVRYLRRIRRTVDGIPSETLTIDDMYRKFAEGYGFCTWKIRENE